MPEHPKAPHADRSNTARNRASELVAQSDEAHKEAPGSKTPAPKTPATKTSAPKTPAPKPPLAKPPYPPAKTVWYVIGMLALLNMLDNIDRGIISLLIEPIKRDLGLSDVEIGILTGIAFSGSYALVGLPMSRFADTGIRRNILSFGVVLWSAATTMGALAQNFWHLFFSRAGTGAGESLKGPNALSMISDLVPREKLPRAMALYSGGIVGGMAFSMILGGALLGYFSGRITQGPFGLEFTDWQMVYLLVGAPGLLVALIFFFTVKEPVRRDRKKDKPPLIDTARFLWRNFRFYGFFFLGTALAQIELSGLMIWRIPFFERTYGWGPEITGPIFGTIQLVIYPISLTLGALIGERMAKAGNPGAMVKLPLITFGLTLPFTILSPLMPTPELAVGMALCSSIIFGIGGPATTSAIQIVTPNEFRGQINALYLFTISVIGTALAPLAVSLITTLVFGDESMLRYSLVITAALFGITGWIAKLISLRPYTQMVRRLDSQDAAD